MSAAPRMSVITDWHVHNAELPDVSPDAEFECVIRSQRTATLYKIVSRALHLVHLQIGTIEFPFQLVRVDRIERTYHPVMAPRIHEIEIVAGMEIRIRLHNYGVRAAKPVISLLVREEST